MSRIDSRERRAVGCESIALQKSDASDSRTFRSFRPMSPEESTSKRVHEQYDHRSHECHQEARRVAFFVHSGHSAD